MRLRAVPPLVLDPEELARRQERYTMLAPAPVEVEMVNLIAGDAAAAMISGNIAAAELWDPFGAQVLAELEGSRELSHSKEPQWLKSALIAAGLYGIEKTLAQNKAREPDGEFHSQLQAQAIQAPA